MQRGVEQRRNATHIERGRGARRHAASALPEREKETMKAFVARQLRMEGGREQSAVAHRDHGGIAEPRENDDTRTDPRDLRRADEDGVERTARHALYVDIRLERIDLTAEGVPLDGDIEELSERMRMTRHVLREEDRSGAGAPHRHAVGGSLADLRDDPVVLRELADRRALAARDDERVDVVELLGPAHVDTFRANAAERGEVLAEIALEAEDADASGLVGAITSRGRQGVRRRGWSRARDHASALRDRARPRR